MPIGASPQLTDSVNESFWQYAPKPAMRSAVNRVSSSPTVKLVFPAFHEVDYLSPVAATQRPIDCSPQSVDRVKVPFAELRSRRCLWHRRSDGRLQQREALAVRLGPTPWSLLVWRTSELELVVDLAFATWRRSAVQALARYQRVRVPDASEALWLGSRGEMPFLGVLAGTTPFRKSHPCDSLGRCSRKDRKLAVGTRSAVCRSGGPSRLKMCGVS